ncbi:beta-glucosidase BglX [Streptomyces sp. NPDC055400]
MDTPALHAAEIDALLGRMTPEEKLGQLQQLAWTGDTGPTRGQADLIEELARTGRVGSVLNLHGAGRTNYVQRLAVEESRLGIPLLFGLDVIHGFWTTFPISLAQAASFDPDTARVDGEISAREARSNGVHWAFSPMIDVTRDPRWGRISESCGEDPHLASVFAKAKVRGYQGSGAVGGPIPGHHVAACAKHFVGYGAIEGGREYNTVDLSESRLRNLHLPPFRAAVDAGVATVMAAFNSVNGVPAHADPRTVTGILKQDWGFEGVVVSDWTGVEELIAHGYAADRAEAARLALNAGCDMEMVSRCLADHGAGLVADGRIAAERLDDAVARVLRLKFRLGLFDQPYTDEPSALSGPTAHTRRAARRAAARSMVLLKNDDALLPLPHGLGSLAVVGPFADSTDLNGAWAGPGGTAFPAVTAFAGIREAAGRANIRYVRGVEATGSDTAGITEAVEAARQADVTVIVTGEPAELSGEGGSRSDIGLPGAQDALIEAVARTGRPFVVVLTGGRPLALGAWVEDTPAVVAAWHPGIEGGRALADILFGRVNPGGKLPAAFPRATGQIPAHYNHESTGRPLTSADHAPRYGSRYLDLPAGPRFPFGHGLSYTTFEISSPRLGSSTLTTQDLSDGATVDVWVTVRNSGDRSGDEVVQLYLHDPVASLVQPVRRLRAFRRVTVSSGRTRTVRFRLTAEDLGFWSNDPTGEFVLEPGDIHLYVGTSSESPAEAGILTILAPGDMSPTHQVT